jgi:hypothetical protein
MPKQVKYKIFNSNGKGFGACGCLSPSDLGLGDNCSDLLLIAAAKSVLKSRFSKNKVIYVSVE